MVKLSSAVPNPCRVQKPDYASRGDRRPKPWPAFYVDRPWHANQDFASTLFWPIRRLPSPVEAKDRPSGSAFVLVDDAAEDIMAAGPAITAGRWFDSTAADIHDRMPQVWLTRSAASQAGQCGTGRSQLAARPP
jgi:hypothetical protein